jgi:PAS domain S-box-containing protein
MRLIVKSVEDFEGIVFQCDDELNPVYSNKTYQSLKPSEQSELVNTCSEVLKSNTPVRIQRNCGDQFYVFIASPLILATKKTSGVALTGFPISFTIFKDIVLDNMSDAVFYISIIGDQFYFRGANAVFLELTGLKEKDVIDKNALEVIPKQYHEEFFAKYRQTLQEKKILRWEVNTTHQKGERYGDLVLIPILHQNKCHALFGIFHDITDQKLAEIEFAKHYSILHELVESTSDIIFIKDLSSRYIMVNSAGAKFLGISTFDLIGRKDLEMFSEETAMKFITNDRDTLTSGFMKHFEEEFDLNGKHYFFHSAKGPYRDEKGQIAGTIGISRDITQMKLAERDLAHSYSMLVATLNATADGILVLDMNNKITQYNQRFLDLWKISEDLLLNNEYEQILHKVLDQLKNPEECLARLEQLGKDPSLESYDLLIFKDGGFLERYTIPQILDGKVVGRVFSYRVLSKREEAKAKMHYEG